MCMVALLLWIRAISDFDFLESNLNQPNLLLNKMTVMYVFHGGGTVISENSPQCQPQSW